MGGVGVVVGGGVTIQNPHYALGSLGVAVGVNYRRVGVSVQGEPGGYLLHARGRVTHVKNLGFSTNFLREQDVHFPEFDGVHELVEGVTHIWATITGESGVYLAGFSGVIGIVQFTLGTASATHNGVVGRLLPKVNTRLVNPQVTCGRNAALPEGGVTSAGYSVAVSTDDAVAVGVDGVVINPGVLILAKTGQVQFTHRNNRVAAGARDLVAVNV